MKEQIDLECVVMKLVGQIRPIGETDTDNKRFENLKVLCDLTNKLVTTIDHLHCKNKHSHEFSVKRAADYADNFLEKELGITK